MIGQTIRDFEIQSELGAGGYGAVYRAHDTSVDRDVAIKVILPQYAENADFKQRFESEARLVAKLESPRIVPLYSFWQDEQGAFLVMRLIRGGSLRRIMAKQGAMSLSQVMRILSDIAEALAVAHENDVVHRDLKPENILIDERSNAYLTDFGIAKRTTEAEHITEADAIVGTWAYLSPEQVQNIEVSPQSDIYAFGILLYEMLAGKHPFHGEATTMMVMKHLQEPLPDIHDERPDLPRELDDIIQKATAKDPSERYESTLELIDDLKRATTGTRSMSSATMPQIAKKKKASSPEERNRQAMLDNVRTFWVEGVLENSLHDAAMIDLGLKSESGAVDNPWDTLIRTPNGEETLNDESIIDVFERMNGKLLILGDPGSGKTTTLLTLARELLFRAELDDHHPMPVVFNLSSWSENQKPLTGWLVDELNSKYQVPRKVGEKWVADEELLLLLDGLDEVAGDVRDACVSAINTYREEHGFVDVVVCSRSKDYEALTGQLRLKGAIVIQPLDDAQIVDYLDGLGSDVAIVRDLISRDAQLRELAQSPLMLSIMILAYRGKTASDIPNFDDVETQRQHLFDVYIERMFDRRLGEQVFSEEETKHYLTWLAQMMQSQAKSVFNIEELQPSLLSGDDRKRYNTILRVLYNIQTTLIFGIGQWVIASLLPIKVLPFVIGNVIIGMIVALILTLERRIWQSILPHMLLGLLSAFIWNRSAITVDNTTLLFVTFMGFNNVFSSYALTFIQGRMKWDFFQINTKESITVSLKGIKPLFVLLVIFSSLPVNLIMSHWVNPTGGWTNWIFGSTLAGIGYAALMTVTNSLVSEDVSLRVIPNQGIQQSLRTAIRTSIILTTLFLIAFVSAFPAVTLRVAFALAIGYGLSFFAIIIFTYGGFDYVQHFLLRHTLSRIGHLPYDLVRFLDYTTSRILLRKVGGGYIFIHRYMLEYFADLDTEHENNCA